MNMKNKDYAIHIADKLAQLVNKSKESVLMVSGDLRPETYEQPVLKEAITKALDRGVKFEAIIGPDYRHESKFILEKLAKNIFVAPKRPGIHFTISDNKDIRYESSHVKGEAVPEHNHIVKNKPRSAQYLAEVFSEAKADCRRLWSE